jgi:hypothetical protein
MMIVGHLKTTRNCADESRSMTGICVRHQEKQVESPAPRDEPGNLLGKGVV